MVIFSRVGATLLYQNNFKTLVSFCIAASKGFETALQVLYLTAQFYQSASSARTISGILCQMNDRFIYWPNLLPNHGLVLYGSIVYNLDNASVSVFLQTHNVHSDKSAYHPEIYW